MAFIPGFLLMLGVGALTKGSYAETFSVSTNIGVINGMVENVTIFNRSSAVYKFLGIPFAEPPVGNLRFKKPVPKAPFAAPYDAFDHRGACMQANGRLNITFSEDCLYLNVYVPEQQNHGEKLAVMVWIHGGGFNLGDSNMFLGDRLATYGNVIVVTLNYRLSIFGFLSTEDGESPGNYGLWDQRLAIEWVHNNIAAFNGDPDRVTIFGQSAGSGSVIYQGLYSGNKGLFQRVIAESGSTMAWWASTDKALSYAKMVGSAANCDTATTQVLVSCLRTISGERLIEMISNFMKQEQSFLFVFRPVMDKEFVNYDPKMIFQSDGIKPQSAVEFFAGLDFMTGVNSGEGVGGLMEMFGWPPTYDFLPNKTYFETKLVPTLIKEVYGEDTPAALNKIIIHEYTNWTDPNAYYDIRNEYIRMHGDSSFFAQMYKTLDMHSETAAAAATTIEVKKTYMYYLNLVPETHFAGSIPWLNKAMHGEDLPFVFGYGLSYKTATYSPKDWEIDVSKNVMSLWTNFAKTGDPNLPDNVGLGWKPYTTTEQYYLEITKDMTSSNVKQRWNIRAPYFWYDVVPSIIALGKYGQKCP